MKPQHVFVLLCLVLSSYCCRALSIEQTIPIKNIQQKSNRYLIPTAARFQLNTSGAIKETTLSQRLLESPSLNSIVSGYSKISSDINEYYRYILVGKPGSDFAKRSGGLNAPVTKASMNADLAWSDRSDEDGRRHEFEKKIITKEFILNSTVYQAVVDQGETLPLVQQYVDLFSWDIDFYLDPKRGDKIRIQYEKYFKYGKFFKYGKILAAQYIGQNKYQSAFLYGKGSKEEYYNEDGTPIRKKFLKLPVKFGYKTSAFSIRRFHPIAKKYRRHTGIDYGAPMGTPILSTAQGLVKYSGWKSGYGKVVVIQHSKDYETYYGHCSKILVEPGQWVNQGDIIAKVGQTGLATGPHVHYEVRIKDIPINPTTLINGQENRIEPEQLAGFQKIVENRLTDLNAPQLAVQEESRFTISSHIKPAAIVLVKAFFF